MEMDNIRGNVTGILAYKQTLTGDTPSRASVI